jgi:hypothetical protein
MMRSMFEHALALADGVRQQLDGKSSFNGKTAVQLGLR